MKARDISTLVCARHHNDGGRLAAWQARCGLAAGAMARRASSIAVAVLLLALTAPGAARADVSDVTVADVTTRAFSVIWLSSEAVADGRVRVFTDEEGLDEITGEVGIQLVSTGFPPALDLGIVKVDVTGLSADTTVYFQTETTDLLGNTVTFPAAAPLLPVTTATLTTRANADNAPIVNDLILHEVFQPDGVTAAPGTLLIVKVPGVSDYPISAFVGEGIEAPASIADLNNIFDASGTSAEVLPGEPLQITEFRGLLCTPSDHKLIRTRRAPPHEETPAITELEAPAPCFAPDGVAVDFDCDGRVGLVDFTRLAGNFDLAAPECAFNSDFDLDQDGRVGLVDFTRFASVFGAQE
jgi:hypothetical protein